MISSINLLLTLTVKDDITVTGHDLIYQSISLLIILTVNDDITVAGHDLNHQPITYPDSKG